MNFRKLVSFVFSSILLVSLTACESQGVKPSQELPQVLPAEQPQMPVEPKPQEKQQPPKCKCPVQKPAVKKPPAPKAAKAPKAPKSNLTIVGETEYVRLIPSDIILEARIDTGATGTSMTANELTEFERDGKTWVKFYVPDENGKPVEISRPVISWISIKQHSNESVRRPVVMMTLMLGNHEQTLKVNLTDRSQYIFPLLIGRNFLQGVMMVDVSQKNTQGIPYKATANQTRE